MINIDIINLEVIIAFWLCFSRWLVILFQIPLFDNASIPAPVKILTSLLISYAFFPFLKPVILQDIANIGVQNFWLLTIFYTVVGLLIGYIVRSIVIMFSSAGSIISQQIGFSAVRYFDMSQGSQVSPFEMLISWILVILILTSGALFPIFKGAFISFSSINTVTIGNLGMTPHFFFEFFKNIFLSAVLISSPLILSNVIIMAVLGIISRMIPQMNVLMISFVVNIGMGLIVLMFSTSELIHVIFELYTEKLGTWYQFITN